MIESLKHRKKPTEPRYGNLIKIVDLIQDLLETVSNTDEFGDIVDKNKLWTLTKELRCFDNTTIGNLYLTSGGRVVLDKGYGEYFNETDKKIFTLEELTNGIKYDEFVEKITSKIRTLINDKLDNIDKTYAGQSQDYKEGVDEGLKVALWILRVK